MTLTDGTYTLCAADHVSPSDDVYVATLVYAIGLARVAKPSFLMCGCPIIRYVMNRMTNINPHAHPHANTLRASTPLGLDTLNPIRSRAEPDNNLGSNRARLAFVEPRSLRGPRHTHMMGCTRAHNHQPCFPVHPWPNRTMSQLIHIAMMTSRGKPHTPTTTPHMQRRLT